MFIFTLNVTDVLIINIYTFRLMMNQMDNSKTTNLIEALKEYNKSLSEQISRIKSFINEIDKQINHHQTETGTSSKPDINVPFSRDYLAYKAKKNVN
jgi:hypothetical protein